MASEDTILNTLVYALNKARPTLERYDAYYEGEQPLKFMSNALKAEFGERITELVLNWPQLVADAYENRLDIEGFRFAGKSSGDEALWAAWQANDMDEQSQQGHLDSVALSRAYAVIGTPDSKDDEPIVTVESPLQVFAKRDPRTRKINSAVKRWDEGDEGETPEQHAMLYLPNSSRHLVNSKGEWLVSGSVDEHNLGVVPVVALVNRPRTLRPDGVSEFRPIMGVADAANKLITDMMVSAEFHAMPRRWAAGMKASDFRDDAGNEISPWSRDAGTLWSTEQKEAKFGQFNEADLVVFHNSIKLLAQIALQLAGLPPHYMGFSADYATSADAIRSSETQLVKRVERKMTYLGGSWEQVMRLVIRFKTGKFDPDARTLETVWRDPSTPTVAQRADATLKLATPIQNGRAIIPLEQARIDLGYTDIQRKSMAAMDLEASRDLTMEQVARDLAPVPTFPDAGDPEVA